MPGDGFERGEPGLGVHGMLLHAGEDGERLMPVGERVVAPIGAVESGGEFVLDGWIGGGKFERVVVLGDGGVDVAGLRVGAGEVEVARGRCGRAFEFGGEKVFGAGQGVGRIVDGGEKDSVAAGVVEEGVASELARGIGRCGEARGDGGVGRERLIEVGEIDGTRRGAGEVSLDERRRGRTPDRTKRLPATGDGGKRLCLGAVSHGVVECGVSKVDVAVCGERGEGGGIAAQQQIEVADAKLRVATEDEGAGEAGFVGSVAGIAEGLRGLGQDWAAAFHKQARCVRFQVAGQRGELKAALLQRDVEADLRVVALVAGKTLLAPVSFAVGEAGGGCSLKGEVRVGVGLRGVVEFVEREGESLFLFRRVVGLDSFTERVNRGSEILVGGLAALRGEVLAEARGFIAGDVFAGEFGGEDGG